MDREALRALLDDLKAGRVDVDAAVAKLRIVQGPVGAEKGAIGLATLAARPVSHPLTAEVAQVADPGLRDALARLGAEVKAGR